MYELTQAGEAGKAILQKFHFKIEYIMRSDCQLKQSELKYQEWFRPHVVDHHALDWTRLDVCYIKEERWAIYGITEQDAPVGLWGFANMSDWSGVLDYYNGTWTDGYLAGLSDNLNFAGPTRQWGYQYTFKRKCCCNIMEDVDRVQF